MERPVTGNLAAGKRQLTLTENYEALCEEAVRRILSLSAEKIEACGRFTLLLSGGTTPEGVYSLMAGPRYRDRFRWNKIHFFWGDERCVPADDPKSNYRTADEALFSKVAVPRRNLHPITTTGLDPTQAAARYERELQSFFRVKSKPPCFDLILLGLGKDGHTASLFPGDPALSEKERWVVPVMRKEADPPQRITVTLPVINQAEDVFFLVSGVEKAAILKRVLEGKSQDLLPAQRVQPSHGKVLWVADQAAASLLDRV